MPNDMLEVLTQLADKIRTNGVKRNRECAAFVLMVRDELQRLRQAIEAARRELLRYAGDEADWDDGTRDAMAQMQAAEKARTT